ncbi:type 4a pilus biogenesis protein PilO [Pelomonas sp. KK5]|uniref:type 4a pilus biogenesis protein PilO n=1 Tax=Pelomonas sp. KK5 TaxID=1855730 RepID=UPI00097CB901|nr:type 4a pilus biogenesis protein PilO [Pelomonas sp. KK5]
MRQWFASASLRLGHQGFIGLALLLAALLAHGALVAPRIAQRDALASRPYPAAAPAEADTGAGATEAALAEFRRTLPATASVPQWIARIRSAAIQSGLGLRSVDYRLERSADSPILRYRITLPASGSYAQVRNFIATVLAEVPALAVDDVQMKRDGDAHKGQGLDARIRLTLFIATE